jgi:hypothetical protein
MDSPESGAHRDVNEDGDDKQSNSKEKNENKPPLFADGWISVRYGISPRRNEKPGRSPGFFLYEKTDFVRLLSYLWRLIPVNRGPSLFPYVYVDYLDLYWI